MATTAEPVVGMATAVAGVVDVEVAGAIVVVVVVVAAATGVVGGGDMIVPGAAASVGLAATGVVVVVVVVVEAGVAGVPEAGAMVFKLLPVASGSLSACVQGVGDEIVPGTADVALARLLYNK